MSYTITNLKEDMEGILHGTTIDDITNFYTLVNRASRQLLEDIDPQETKRITQFTNPIYSSVYDYALPTDLKGNKIIDIRPQVNRHLSDVYSQTYSQQFSLDKEYTIQARSNIKFNNGLKTVQINYPGNDGGIVLNSANSITSNGTWAATSTASNLTEDYVNYVSSDSSLKFDLATGANPSTGYLENSTMTQIDLSDHEDESALFLWVYMPTGSDFTSVQLRWGSDSSNYWYASATTTQSGTAFQNGWNLLQFNWSSATQVGTPNSEEVDYLRITLTYNGTAQSGVRIDNIVSRMGQILEIEYYSKYLFRDGSTSAFKETVTDDSDVINLDTESYNLLTFLVALYCVQQQAGAEGDFDMKFFQSKYYEAKERYQNMYKSEVQKPRQFYYTRTKPVFMKWGFRRF